ncbi:hypothetical protein U1Q18_045732, partial [Sarracenia purpurea var. burkii]
MLLMFEMMFHNPRGGHVLLQRAPIEETLFDNSPALKFTGLGHVSSYRKRLTRSYPLRSMISVEALCEHALTVSAAPDYCSEQIRSFFRDSRGSSARLVGQKREDIGGRLPTSLLEGRSAISGFVFVPQPWGMLPAKLFSQICSTSGSGKSPTNSGSESRSLFRNRLSSIKFGVEPLLANGCRGSPSGGRDQCSSRLDSASGGRP